MAGLVQKLTAEAPGGHAGFLNDLVRELWPNINVAGSNMIKSIVEPMFQTMLPGPLKGLKFTKIDLGPKPIEFSNVLVTKTESDGIELDLNIDWIGECDIILDGKMVPSVGVKHIQLHGRLCVLLSPLTNIIPLIGAAQLSFINPPVLKLDFTGAANVADFAAIDGAVRGIILGIINSMFTLPNRFFLRLDANADYFKTYHEPIGIVRVTVEKAWGFAEESTSKAKKLLAKITRAAPDCYARVDVGGEPSWRTATQGNRISPEWNETHDFVVSDLNQCIKIDVRDEDVNKDDDVGLAVTTVQDVIDGNGKFDLVLHVNEKETEGRVALSCKFFKFGKTHASFAASEHSGSEKICGIVNIAIASVFGIKGARETLKPSVVVTWGTQHRLQTAIKSDAPGTDINNPTFDQSFRILGTSDMMNGSQPFRLALLNGEQEVGAADVTFDEVVNSPNLALEKAFDVGDGTTIRANIRLRGMSTTETARSELPDRTVPPSEHTETS